MEVILEKEENNQKKNIEKKIFQKKPNLKNKVIKKSSISIERGIYETLKKIRNEMSFKLGGRVTFNMVLQSLLNDHLDLMNTSSELKNIQNETEKMQNYLKSVLKLALINTNQQPQYIPISGIQLYQNNTTPPPPSPYPIKNQNDISLKYNILSKYNPPNTGDLKKDYVNEIKQIFNGVILKPSEVVKLTKPKHLDAKIEEIDEFYTIPDIFKRSIAKRFKKIEVESANV